MTKLAARLVVIGLLASLVVGTLIGCDDDDDDDKDVAAPAMSIVEVTKEKVTDFSENTFGMLAGLMSEMGGAQALGGIALQEVQSATMDMALRITNPNEFEICVESLLLTVSVNDVVTGRPNLVDAVYIPANTSVVTHRTFTFAPFDAMVGGMFEGKSPPEIMGSLMPVWGEVTKGAPTWTVDCHAFVSSEYGNISKDYQLNWSMP